MNKQEFLDTMIPIRDDAAEMAKFITRWRHNENFSDEEFEETIKHQLIGWLMEQIRNVTTSES